MVLGVVRTQESYHISHRDHGLSWEQTPSPAVAHGGDLCLPHSHPPVLLPSPPPQWPSPCSSSTSASSYLRTFAHALSAANSSARSAWVSSGLGLNPICSVRLPRAPPASRPLRPFLLYHYPICYRLCSLFGRRFLPPVRHPHVRRYFVCFVLFCVLSTQSTARHPAGTHHVWDEWIST